MRLLNTQTKILETFNKKPPTYAILSHVWLDQEVTFQDMSRPDIEQIPGYHKLSSACDKARSIGIAYLWMDTCCIDKSSSAELSEAINSMHTWYQCALVCIVYLHDVTDQYTTLNSSWFGRGWTLQELIAPPEVLFINERWEEIGTKSALAEEIRAITGISEYVLLTGDVKEISIATRISWISRRMTTRQEDMAYSLMGIFGVNIPTIYGEGGKAFIRLQKEIVNKSNDQSIFAWGRRLICHFLSLVIVGLTSLTIGSNIILKSLLRVWKIYLVHTQSTT